jgi:hypothetical protein
MIEIENNTSLTSSIILGTERTILLIISISIRFSTYDTNKIKAAR